MQITRTLRTPRFAVVLAVYRNDDAEPTLIDDVITVVKARKARREARKTARKAR